MSQSQITPNDTRDKLVNAAAEAFFEHGYGVSMDTIAARAGVAKQTLYNHFSGKEALFHEVVAVGSRLITTAMAHDGDLRTRLVRFAITFRATVFGADCLAMYRMMVAESPRFPQMAEAFYQAGPGHGIRQLSALLEAAIRDGSLRCDTADPGADARFAAETLLGMLTGVERSRALMGIAQPAGFDAPERAERLVDCFLRAFGAGLPRQT